MIDDLFMANVIIVMGLSSINTAIDFYGVDETLCLIYASYGVHLITIGVECKKHKIFFV
jgi:hypothetical protein